MTRCVVALSTLAVAVAIVSNAAARSRPVYFKVKSPVARGQLAHVVVDGGTGLCRITVSQKGTEMQPGGRAGVNALAPKRSNRSDDNRVAWEWHVSINAPLGRWSVRVTCGSAAPLKGAFFVTN